MVSEIWAKQVSNDHFKTEGGATRCSRFKYMVSSLTCDNMWSYMTVAKILLPWLISWPRADGKNGRTDRRISNSIDPSTLYAGGSMSEQTKKWEIEQDFKANKIQAEQWVF